MKEVKDVIAHKYFASHLKNIGVNNFKDHKISDRSKDSMGTKML